MVPATRTINKNPENLLKIFPIPSGSDPLVPLGPSVPCSLLLPKKDRHNRAAFLLPARSRLSRRVLHLLGVHIKIRVDTLHVVQIFERFQQPDHLTGRCPFQLVVG